MIAAACALAACGDDPGPQGDAAVHVDHYDYTFDLATRAAHAELAYTFETAGNCVTLPFRAGAPDPDTLAMDGAPIVAADQPTDALHLCGAHGHAAGGTGTLAVDTSVALATIGTSQVGYSITNDATAAHDPLTYMVSWVEGCDRFGPCDHRPDRFATYTFHVTHDAALAVACPGTISEPSATETTCDFAFDGGPTYSAFGFAAYPRAAWVESDVGAWGSAHVTLYDRADTGVAAGLDRTYHAGFLAWMEQTFGPYPYGDALRVLVAPTYWAGFEHPGNIMLDDGLLHGLGGSAYNLAHTLNHEMGHQWAGDQTTLANTYDFVWKESMAEYLAFVYEDSVDPATALRTARNWKADSVGSKYFPVPEDHPALFDYYGEVYGPGPLILFRQLEVLTSRAQVIAALQSVLGHPRALSVDDVVAALAASTGLDLTAYRAAWIHGTGAPVTPAIRATYDGATTSLHVVQTTATDRRCAFHVALVGAGGAQQLVAVDTFRNGVDQTIAVSPAPTFAVTGTSLDPSAECLVTAASP